ncbi:MAG: DUF2183 domain-containing protein [Flaviflexus sp.]|nr:DUF2183 domain-containing protein [Flaviflexus sp.]
MAVADIARRIEDSINRRGTVRRAKAGWRPSIIGFSGYGTVDSARVLARIVMADPQSKPLIRIPRLPAGAHSVLGQVREVAEAAQKISDSAQRGFHQFFTTQVGFLPVTVRAGNKVIRTKTDRSGYVDVLVRGHGLEPGWHEVTIEATAAEPARAKILIVRPEARYGVVSDIDDTVMITWLPRAVLAAWNSWMRHTNSRRAVTGMARFYRELLANLPDAPVFYLSTGAWNTLPTLEVFLTLNKFPTGPLLLTDWGPTPTGLFRSGQAHKKTQLRNLIIMFPHIKWILIGDDGQHDPFLYDELAREHPEHVAGIAIRNLNPVEQVLSHGTPEALEDRRSQADEARHGVPTIKGQDGYELLGHIEQIPIN